MVQLSKAFDEDKLAMMLEDLGFEKNNQAAAEKFFQIIIVKIRLVEKTELNCIVHDKIAYKIEKNKLC